MCFQKQSAVPQRRKQMTDAVSGHVQASRNVSMGDEKLNFNTYVGIIWSKLYSESFVHFLYQKILKKGCPLWQTRYFRFI